MAKKETTASNNAGKSTSAGHNVANNQNGVREALARACSLDDQIASSVKQHINPLKEERARVFRGLKKEFGIKSGIARAQYKRVRLAHEAQGFEKDEERAALAVTHEALHSGEQVDFVDLLKRIAGEIRRAGWQRLSRIATTLVVLYADLATATGWASWGLDRLPASGAWHFPKTGDNVGWFFRSAYDIYPSELSTGEVTSTVFESPIMRSGNETTITTLRKKVYGLAGVFEIACRDLEISCTEADYGSALGHFKGSGDGRRSEKKRRVMQACRDRGWDSEDDNEAEALAGLDSICHVRGISVPWPCGPILAGGAVGR